MVQKPLSEQQNYASVDHLKTLIALAEELKHPLVQISHLSEAHRANRSTESVEAIELTSRAAISLVDGLLLSLRLYTTEEPKLQPISLASVLQDTAHNLSSFAKQSNCQLQLHVSARSSVVIADPTILQAALSSLGLMFIESSCQQEDAPVVMLAAHRSRWGMVTGLYSQQQGLSTDMYRRARQLFGQANRPFSQLMANSGAGAIIADALLHSMSSHLHVSHHQKQSGLAATLLPSQQLSLV